MGPIGGDAESVLGDSLILRAGRMSPTRPQGATMPDTPPLMEFDPAREALVDPTPPFPPPDFPTRGVLCFFHDILSAQESAGRLRRIASQTWEDGEHVWYAIDHHG